MPEKKLKHSELSPSVKHKLTAEDQINFLERKLEEAKLEVTDKNIALIEMRAARDALYQSVQDSQMKLAEIVGQHDNDIQAYQKELTLRLQEKRALQEQIDILSIKARRYDEFQESVIKMKTDAQVRAHNIIDEAQERAYDTVTLISNIEKEMELFSEDIVLLRHDIKTGTLTLDDRLDTVYIRLRKNLDKLTEIKKDFYKRNSLPMDEQEQEPEFPDGKPPVVKYQYEAKIEEKAEKTVSEKPEKAADKAVKKTTDKPIRKTVGKKSRSTKKG